MTGRAWCLETWAASQEDQEGAVGAVGIGDLASEDGKSLARRLTVVEWNCELVLGQNQAGNAVDGGHPATVTRAQRTGFSLQSPS